MKRGIRFLSQAVAIALLLSAGTIPPTTSARTPSTPTLKTASTHYQVRLRKLHLVRPDLILYPIQYEVYC
jgi:hypothetical protein